MISLIRVGEAMSALSRHPRGIALPCPIAGGEDAIETPLRSVLAAVMCGRAI